MKSSVRREGLSNSGSLAAPTSFCSRRFSCDRGFALVISLSLMVLLTVLSVGLLTLSAIGLRSSVHGLAMAEARSNARLSIMLALGALQKEAGSDKRITVDAGIRDGRPQAAAVGVWDSWSPKLAENPTQTSPNYRTEKSSRFRTWLLSNPAPQDLATENWIETAPNSSGVALFEKPTDGFDLKGAPLPLDNGTAAWALVQENTKAKINVDGPDRYIEPNDVLLAQARPHLGLSATLKQPENGWSLRAGKVLSLQQAVLDPALVGSGDLRRAGGNDYTPFAAGLLTNVVDGGLKTDLNLGFEMSDEDFARGAWDGIINPFHSDQANYKGQRPLFKPLTKSGQLQVTANYGVIANYVHKFNAGVVPTFDTLRSHYRMARHLYRSQGETTVFERPSSSTSVPVISGTPVGTVSQTGVRPVLDRLLYFFSVWVDGEKKVNLVVTPVLTLWNPHNVALEMEGAVVYPWMDFPVNVAWRQYGANGNQKVSTRTWQSTFLSSGRDTGEGRTRLPYFFLELTGSGDGSTTKPVRLEPGEVRVFSLVDPTPKRFNRLAADKDRTWRMRPVGDISQFVVKGGLAIRQTKADNTNGNDGFTPTDIVDSGDQIEATIEFTRDQHHYFISVEDAGRILGRSPQVISEIQSHSAVLTNQTFTTPRYRGAELTSEPKQVGVLESYHRVAVDANQVADLVYTTNPRQPHVNRYLIGGGTFAAGPHYEASMRACASIAGAGIQITMDGRQAFYGASNSASSGRSQLAFFETPRESILSIAGFQHADLSASAYGPSNQMGNSWASPYLPRTSVAKLNRSASTGERISPEGLPVVDMSYLGNEALWDAFFFSGAAPTLSQRSGSGSAGVWKTSQATEDKSLRNLLSDFIEKPSEHPLRNTSMRLHQGNCPADELLTRLLAPEGCRRIAANLLLDGAFNVNSTSEEAWVAVLAGLRDAEFEVEHGARPPSGSTPFPRFRNPRGSSNDGWDGYRTVTDADLKKLAREIVTEVRSRGPFLSLGEFVNRQPVAGETGLCGPLQAAIDRSGVNSSSLYQAFKTGNYPVGANISPPNTGVGTPGYLTQADVLNSVGPRLTVRSDTFVIRGYGESKDSDGKVQARAWCEAVVQRMPEWIDSRQDPEAEYSDLTPVNNTFGRRFEIISFREISPAERAGKNS